MTSFLSILCDSYRMLKSKVIFWITLGLSGLVAILFLGLGFNESGVTYFGGLMVEEEILAKGTIGAEMVYKFFFSRFVVGGWLSWATLILALISCASIYPQMMEEGSAGMLLTKRPGRWLVFLAKFVGGLLFMIVQVGLFVTIVFFAMRWRLGTWNPEIFWFIPATVMAFAFLYSFSVLIAVWTRSVLVAILLPLLLWLLSFGIETFETVIYDSILKQEDLIEEVGETAELTKRLEKDRALHQKMKLAYAFFPKVTPVIAEARKAQEIRSDETGLIFQTEIGEPEERSADEELTEGEMRERELEAAMEKGFLEGLEEELEKAEKMENRHSSLYTLGTSLAFSIVMLSLAGRMFSRSDF
ncbi:MAG: hypothetical protein ACON5H_04165 [Akkermansiaceae bacterium]